MTKILIGNPKTQIKNSSKHECLWFVLSVKLVAFFSETLVYIWIEHYLSNSLYKKFLIMAHVIRSPMQWSPSNRKLSVCLTGNEIKEA